jgi:CelD/BcsL family acetyltransferase involved in cellulose biosynthesis
MAMMPTANSTITHYDRQVPPFVEEEMDRLYESEFSSLAHFRIFGGAENASTYLARDGDKIAALLLFRIEKNKLRVINEWIQLDAKEVQRFTDYVFATFPAVAIIMFHAVLPDVGAIVRPYQQTIGGENIQVMLPADVDTYVADLGSATRKNIKRHRNKFERDFPTFAFHAYVREEADESTIREIVRFNRARMTVKGKVSVIDDEYLRQLIRMVKERGFVTAVTIDGRVCAGAITFRIGDTFVSRVSAHDMAYDAYRLGMICCFMTICECIRRGGKRFDFMWGQYEYKTALLGVYRELKDLYVYRSALHRMLNGDTALKVAFADRLLKTKQHLLAAAKPADKSHMSTLGKCVNMARRMKRLPARVTAFCRAKTGWGGSIDAA